MWGGYPPLMNTDEDARSTRARRQPADAAHADPSTTDPEPTGGDEPIGEEQQPPADEDDVAPGRSHKPTKIASHRPHARGH
jgi:hypothetical protein